MSQTTAAVILPVSAPDSGSHLVSFHIAQSLKPRLLSSINHQLGDRIQRRPKPSTNSLVAAAAVLDRRTLDSPAILRDPLIALWRPAAPSLAERETASALVEASLERVGQWLRGELDGH